MLFTTILTTSLAVLSSAFLAKADDPNNHNPQTYDVIVGGAAGLVYTPNQVWANVGDYVTFHFQFKNHTVTQGSFEYPCEELNGGFDSEFVPVEPGVKPEDAPTFTIEVKDEHPIWVHCEQIDHCPSGMVFAVNAPKQGNTFEKYLKNAQESGSYDHHDDGSYSHNDDGSYSHHDGRSYNHKDDGSYGHKDGGSYKHKDDGSNGHKDHGSYNHKDDGSYNHKDDGSNGHKDHGSYNHKDDGSNGHKDDGSYNHKDDGSYNHKDDGSYNHKDDGSYNHKDDGSNGHKDHGSYKRSEGDAEKDVERRGLLSRIMGKRNFVKA